MNADAEAEGADSVKALKAEIQRLKTRSKCCAAFIKGTCKDEDCIYAHVDAEVAEEHKRAEKAYKKAETEKRGRSPSRSR